jgi:hypothetical protein
MFERKYHSVPSSTNPQIPITDSLNSAFPFSAQENIHFFSSIAISHAKSIIIGLTLAP